MIMIIICFVNMAQPDNLDCNVRMAYPRGSRRKVLSVRQIRNVDLDSIERKWALAKTLDKQQNQTVDMLFKSYAL